MAKLFSTGGENLDNDFWNEMSLLLGNYKSKSRYYNKKLEKALYERDIATLMKKAQKEDGAVYRALVRRYIREMKPLREFDIRKIKKYAAKNTSPGMLIKCRTKDGRVRYYINAGYDKNGKPIIKRMSDKQRKMFLSKKLRKELEEEYRKRNRNQIGKTRHKGLWDETTVIKKTVTVTTTELPEPKTWFEKRFVALAKDTSLGNSEIFAAIVLESGMDETNRKDLNKYFSKKDIKPIEEIRTEDELKKELSVLDKSKELALLRQVAMKQKTLEIKRLEEKEFRKKIQKASPSLA